MKVEPLDISGAWLINGHRFADERGWFQEWFKYSALFDATGVQFAPVQANISRSAAGVIRGIHYSTAEHGQGKLVTVMAGEVDDYVIDLRPGSPTFGQWRRVRLSSDNGNALLLDPHLGHAFQARTDDTVVSYLVTAEFDPEAEVRSDGRRQGASCAMGVATGHARTRQNHIDVTGTGQHVDHLVTRQMSALEQHRPSTLRQQGLCSPRQITHRSNRSAQQQRRFIQIGGDDGSQWEQLVHQHTHGGIRNQTVTTGGHHHRIEQIGRAHV